MFNTASFRLADAGIDPKTFACSVRDLSLPDSRAMLRSADVSGRVDAAFDAASEAVRGVIEQLPGQRRRRRRLPILVAALVLGGLAAVGVAGWLRRRSALSTAAPDLAPHDQAFDTHALERATNDGMTITTGDRVRPHTNGELRELSTVGDLT